MDGGTVLRATGIAKRFGRRRVLHGLDLAVRPGEAVGISGENGTGKTTLLRILAGLLHPDAGAVERPPRLGYAPQVPLLYEQLTPWEHFRYFAVARRLDLGEWTARARTLLGFYRFEPWAHARVATLSEGTKQKLNLVLALLADPQLLLLDEPYGGFEWETYLRFWEHVREIKAEGKAMVIVSHLFYDRTRLDRVLQLRDGALVQAA